MAAEGVWVFRVEGRVWVLYLQSNKGKRLRCFELYFYVIGSCQCSVWKVVSCNALINLPMKNHHSAAQACMCVCWPWETAAYSSLLDTLETGIDFNGENLEPTRALHTYIGGGVNPAGGMVIHGDMMEGWREERQKM